MDLKTLQQLTDQVKALTTDAYAELTSGKMDVPGCIDVGAKLSAIAKATEKSLEIIKATLREEALQRNNQQSGSVELRPGVCQVRIPKSKFEVRKDADMPGLKTKMGSTFPLVFEEVVTYKPRTDFKDLVASCDPTIQPDIMAVVELKDPSPQVFFQAE